ncbi:helix-turn-helix domain-containing protein [Brevibacterium sp. 5221]|uniref:Helix-turn-helix domain-containing protein n=1 Tax=Brevibacterium rongguiense TaxID=2695267 RepID=A0A6N9H818_9MICO|nr:TOBE domain-containing protein [Brevibacterium rongguiense]MYM19714.1 helix-turn-helix domain-containing protein [Brevibacterium rongguiense]
MSMHRVAQAAAFVGVSTDTLRRWIAQGRLSEHQDSAGRLVVDGAELAALARDTAVLPADPSGVASSARNRLVGLVTKVTTDTVMAQVDMQCGPHRIVSLMSREAVEDLDLKPGDVAVASVKATTVVVETPRD